MGQKLLPIGIAVLVIIPLWVVLTISTAHAVSATPPEIPIYGSLEFSDSPPALNQTATLTYVMNPTDTWERLVSARIVLPEGLVWVSGGFVEGRYLFENVHIIEDMPVQVGGIVKATENGRWNIQAFVTEVDSPSDMTLENLTHSAYGAAVINISV